MIGKVSRPMHGVMQLYPMKLTNSFSKIMILNQKIYLKTKIYRDALSKMYGQYNHKDISSFYTPTCFPKNNIDTGKKVKPNKVAKNCND